MKQADLALYRQKSAGRDGYRFFDPQMMVEADARHQLVHDLRASAFAGNGDERFITSRRSTSKPSDAVFVRKRRL